MEVAGVWNYSPKMDNKNSPEEHLFVINKQTTNKQSGFYFEASKQQFLAFDAAITVKMTLGSSYGYKLFYVTKSRS